MIFLLVACLYLGIFLIDSQVITLRRDYPSRYSMLPHKNGSLLQASLFWVGAARCLHLSQR